MPKLTPRQRRREKTKQAILETAQELISEKGPEGISIREIARRIDYSPAGLYKYFNSKDAILEAVCTDGMQELSAAFHEVAAGLSSAQRLIEYGLIYADFARRQPEKFMLMFNTLPSTRTSLEQPVEPDSPYQILLDTVRAGLTAGELKKTGDCAAESIAFSLWALMHGRAMLELTFLRDFEMDFDLVHRWAMEIFVNGLQVS